MKKNSKPTRIKRRTTRPDTAQTTPVTATTHREETLTLCRDNGMDHLAAQETVQGVFGEQDSN